MQPVTGPPRAHLTEAEVVDIITGDSLEVSAGLELLDQNRNLIEDISDDLVGGKIMRDNHATIHGTCELQLARQLTWGKQYVQPYMILKRHLTPTEVVRARFNLGVYILTTPATPRGEDPVIYECQGYDLLYLLSRTGPGDTYVVASGTTYSAALQAVVTAAGVGVPLALDGTGGATTTPQARVWCLTPGVDLTWLEIINDLLADIGYRPLYASTGGVYRSDRFIDPANRGVEWTFDTTNKATNIVGEYRVMNQESHGAPNWWRFVRMGMDAKPVEGAGIYTVTDTSDRPSSYTNMGVYIRKVTFLDAADHASLVARGDRIVAEDKQRQRWFEIQVDPLPLAWHADVVRLKDEGRDDKCEVSSWELPLDGSQGTWVLEVV